MTGEARSKVEPTPIRAAISRRMVASKRDAPHFYVTGEIEMDALLAAIAHRNGVGAEGGDAPRTTVTAFLVRAAALALAEHPMLNAVWDGGAVYQVTALNIGVAIALEGGLVAPALLDCRHRPVADIAAGLADLTARARHGRLRAPEISDATFTVSNLGMFDVASFSAIIAPPQVAILALGRVEPRPVVRDGQICVRHLMTATVSADHRVVDGADVARFLTALKGLLASPGALEGSPV